MKAPRLSDFIVAAIALALVASLWADSRLVDTILASFGRSGAVTHLPVAVNPVSTFKFFSTRQSLIYLAIGAFQVTLLFALRERLERSAGVVALGICAVAFVAMVAVDLRAPAAISSDAYAYIGYGKLSSIRAAYAIANPPFAAPFAAINQLWGTPLTPCVYGPLWVALTHVLLAPFASLGACFEALRILGAVATVALVGLVYAIGRSTVLAAVTALTPPLHLQFIMDAHNDILAIVPILLALVAARRSWWGAALALTVIAATIKLNVVLLGLLVPLPLPLRQRIAFGAGLAGATALAYAALSGTAFLGAVRYVKFGSTYQQMNEVANGHAFLRVEGIALVLALAVCALAFFTRRIWFGASGIFVALGATLVLPSYLVWGLPYALLASARSTLVVMCASPILVVLLEPEAHFRGHGPVTVALVAICAVTLATAWTTGQTNRVRAAGGWKQRA